eukprot:2959280-Amphidinium_carterae.1
MRFNEAELAGSNSQTHSNTFQEVFESTCRAKHSRPENKRDSQACHCLLDDVTPQEQSDQDRATMYRPCRIKLSSV